MSNITAKLVAASRVGDRVVGTIFGDTKGRFESGQRIITSPICLIEDDIVYTANSIYQVTWTEREVV